MTASSPESADRGCAVMAAAAVLLIGSLVGLRLERAAIGDTWSRRAHVWWGLGVIRTPEGGHRYHVLSWTDDELPTADDEYLVLFVNGWCTEEFKHKGHWLLDGLELEHRMRINVHSFSDAPEHAPAILLDQDARVQAARLIAPLLEGFRYRPAIVQNGYSVSRLNRPRLALRILLLALPVASGLVLLRTGYRVARTELRRIQGQCVACGYQRHGLPADVPCPECGGAP